FQRTLESTNRAGSRTDPPYGRDSLAIANLPLQAVFDLARFFAVGRFAENKQMFVRYQVELHRAGAALPPSRVRTIMLGLDYLLFQRKADTEKPLHHMVGQRNVMLRLARVADEDSAMPVRLEDPVQLKRDFLYLVAELVDIADGGKVFGDLAVGVG